MSNPFGGVVQVLYWHRSVSRGNNIRLLLADLEVPFENVWIGERDEWESKYKKEIEALQANFGTVPVVKLPDGRKIGENLAALRYIARKAGPSYYPIDDPDKALVIDILLDLNEDWRVQRRTIATYETGGKRLPVLATIEHLISSHPYHGNGPYILGDQISIADFYTFQTLNEDPKAIRSAEEEKLFPELTKLWRAVAARPAVKKLLERQESGDWSQL
ncbi:hypothetical protein HDU93_003605 [Gonapodya sp. JEL0774]|nr:hypothetical protein HDU93_003605 [Gonapodya sp. JEL0774]